VVGRLSQRIVRYGWWKLRSADGPEAAVAERESLQAL
jgi:hypothetical protein